jgi:hypothetical protein
MACSFDSQTNHGANLHIELISQPNHSSGTVMAHVGGPAVARVLHTA